MVSDFCLVKNIFKKMAKIPPRELHVRAVVVKWGDDWKR